MLFMFCPSLFQFHEGPIKTNTQILQLQAEGSFNSMKVRLKLTIKKTLTLRIFCFNSMKVRLKQLAGFDPTYNDLFQFHEGPIKTLSARHL